MSVLEIVVLAVVVLAILFAVFVFLPRIREHGQANVRERELRKRRKRAVSEHQDYAEDRSRRAEAAERRARIAEHEARRERAEAELRREQAALHEHGMADREPIEDYEHEEFATTSSASGKGRSGGERTAD